MTSLIPIFLFHDFKFNKKNIALYFSAISLQFFLEITYAKHTSASTSMAFITIPLMASNEFFLVVFYPNHVHWTIAFSTA